jgi:hypothetical protein
MDLEKVQADCKWKESKLLQNVMTRKENIKIQNQDIKHDLELWKNTSRNNNPINKTVVWMKQGFLSV